MALLDIFRSKPEWQHTDPAVREAAVKRLDAADTEIIAAVARQDTEASVRLAALHRLDDVAVIAELARADASERVRADAAEKLVTIAIRSAGSAESQAALAALTEPRHLAAVARSSRDAATCCHSMDRITDQKLLASIARSSPDPVVRVDAFRRIDDLAQMLDLALRCEFKDVALAAAEKFDDAESLERIASRAKNKAASRRAQAVLDELERMRQAESVAIELAPEPAPAPVFVTRVEEPAAAPAQPAVDERAALHRRWLAARRNLCDRIATVSGARTSEMLAELQAEWEKIPRSGVQEEHELQGHFNEELAAAHRRHEAEVAAKARAAQIEEICGEAERICEIADLADAGRRWRVIDRRFADLHVGESEEGQRFLRARIRLQEREEHAREAARKLEHENHARLTALAVHIEDLAKSTSPSLKEADRLLRDARAAIAEPGPLAGRRERDEIVTRLESARRSLHPRLREMREDEDWKHWANLGIQEELCGQAEQLLEVTDPEEAHRGMRDIEARWKEASQVPKGQGDALWHRFTAARDQVRAKCEEHFAARAREMAENLKKKEDLCVRAEAIADSSRWVETAQELQKLQGEWKSIGPVPRQQSDAIWKRFHGACDRFFQRRKDDRKHRTEEWSKNLEKKTALCEQAEALAESTDWEKTAGDIKRLQQEWKTVGAVKKTKSDVIWQRFRAACDKFFDRYKNRDQIANAAKFAAREKLCADLEALVPGDAAASPASAPSDLLDRLRAAHTAWRQGPGIHGEQAVELDRRFAAVREKLAAAFPAALEGTEFDFQATRRRMEKLCAKVETLLHEVQPEKSEEGLGTDLAERLRRALAENALGVRGTNAEAKWQAAKGEIDAAHAQWQRLVSSAPPDDATRQLAARFERACSRFAAARPGGGSRDRGFHQGRGTHGSTGSHAR